MRLTVLADIDADDLWHNSLSELVDMGDVVDVTDINLSC